MVDWWFWDDLEWLWRLWNAGIIDIGRCRIDIGRCRIDIGRCRIATATDISATATDINATATDINATGNAGMGRLRLQRPTTSGELSHPCPSQMHWAFD